MYLFIVNPLQKLAWKHLSHQNNKKKTLPKVEHLIEKKMLDLHIDLFKSLPTINHRYGTVIIVILKELDLRLCAWLLLRGLLGKSPLQIDVSS